MNGTLRVGSLVALLSFGCVERGAPEPTQDEAQPAKQESKTATAQAKQSGSTLSKKAQTSDLGVDTKPVTVKPTAGDPQQGQFTLEEATQGLGGEGRLVATIDTELGKLDCELYEDKAPITVANFVGLARGTRAWRKDGQWVKKPLYDGTVFHRVVKGFMIQGGDPNGNGSGGPGYVIPDEIWANARHDERGQLCMANRGPNTNGSQFFIMDGKAPHLDGGYTIFGKCSPETVIEKLASVEVRGQSAVDPTKINSVTIKRVK